MNLPQLISVTPAPPVCGQTAKICYDFAGAPPGTNQVTLEVQFDPPNGPTQQIQLTLTEPCAEVDVPADASTLEITDLNGHSRTWRGLCDPGP